MFRLFVWTNVCVESIWRSTKEESAIALVVGGYAITFSYSPLERWLRFKKPANLSRSIKEVQLFLLYR
ncbi:MAG: hypothetical protein RMZ43_019235 [Nostoc sp. CmiVER01]|uniref:hypothetical protein n=1 Tax=Nostoc sp. CmiVER01 TaxID=3075384 RepID=UPI002AD4733F|nr:hypothetical protein [Nostoc sp. CmiVER01]MDZ8126697.1 hypothetical protein [Nostoc sp. CmiVER01]